MNNKEKKYITVLTVIMVILFVFSVLIINSIRTSGHEVKQYYHNMAEVVNSSKGFDIDGNRFILNDEDEHYITFRHIVNSDTFGIIFDSELDNDTNITVWEMESSGLILSEYNVTIEEGERWLFLRDINPGAQLVSLGIEKDVYVYEVFSAEAYSNNRLKAIALVGCFVVFIILFIIFYKFEIFKKQFIISYDWFSERVHRLDINIGVLLLLVVAVVIVSSLIVLGLTHIDEEVFRFNYKTVLLLSVLIGSTIISIIKRKLFVKRFEVLGLIFIALVGASYAILEPTSNGISWDDELHFEKASLMSHAIDGEISFADIDINYYYQAVAIDKVTYSKDSADRNNLMYDTLDKNGFYIKRDTSNIPITYIVFLPMALGSTVARGMMLPYHISVIFGRLFNALFFAICCYMSMKKLRQGKMVVLLLALIPTIAFMSGSYSYDTWLIGLSVLGFSYVFAERQEPDNKMSIASIVIIPISFYLANIIKMVYFPLALVALFISHKKFKSILQSIIYRALVIISSILPFIAVFKSQVSNAAVGDTRGGEAVNQASQLTFIRENYSYVAKVVATFLKEYLNPIRGGSGRINNLAYNGLIAGYMITLGIVIVGCLLHHEDTKHTAFPIWYRLGVILLYVGISIICAVTFYAAYTPVGVDYIAGCQPRYLLPALFPLLFVLTRIPTRTYILDKVGEHNVNMLLCLAMIFINIYCLWMGCVSYY